MNKTQQEALKAFQAMSGAADRAALSLFEMRTALMSEHVRLALWQLGHGFARWDRRPIYHVRCRDDVA